MSITNPISPAQDDARGGTIASDLIGAREYGAALNAAVQHTGARFGGADVALYRSTAEGRGTYRFFTDAMDAEVQTRVTLGAELRDGLAAGERFLMVQPQIDVDSGRFVGVEAVARWRHTKMGLVPPSVFIPIAEQNGLIVVLGSWALREACRQMKEWIDAGIAPPVMAVYVSGPQSCDGRGRALAHTPILVSPSLLVSATLTGRAIVRLN